ncbi:MAG TPA: SpvB/TcaC N-terminal domain-containing protein, partial [Terrimicrobiaceae bacterium]
MPLLVEEADQWVRETAPERVVDGTRYRIQRYRPRLEGLFASIERWTNTSLPAETFWRSISRDNVITWYGRSAESRIADPAEPSHIFAWLICESYDDKGNVIEYSYKPEDSAGIDIGQEHERNRSPETRSANRYIKRIRYGNRTPYFPEFSESLPWPSLPEQWLFEVVFDYGEHDAEAPTPSQEREWLLRNDPFSFYRSRFEIRSYRLCQRVLTFHHVPDTTVGEGYEGVVQSTDFAYSLEEEPSYARNPVFSFLLAATQVAFRRESDTTYTRKSLPPIEFDYTRVNLDGTIHEVDRASLENLPTGIASSADNWLDLDAEGLVGVLMGDAEAWFYKRNLSLLSPTEQNTREGPKARLGATELLPTKPTLAAGTTRSQFIDLAGDGSTELVTLGSPSSGFYERRRDKGWESFTTFKELPVLEWDDPNLRFIDLTGNGIADVLITEDEVLCWHLSLEEAGFGRREAAPQARDEEKGPRLIFSESIQTIYLADMSGDGLTDLVRIRNGEVCYWPNLGYGRFGSKVSMDNSPWFDSPDVFDSNRIRLADLDGSGVTDILYLSGEGACIYFNQSGNRWSPPCELPGFPRIDDHTSVAALDLLGGGTACLV